jgi:hypothetical protein
MKTFITQPTYLPWIGIFKAIDFCDNFVFYDDVQFEKQSWQQRNKIASPNKGESFMYIRVTVQKHHLSTAIKDIRVKNVEFYTEHLKLIRDIYSKSSYTSEVLGVLLEVYSQNYTSLADLNINLIKKISSYIGIKTNFVRSKDLNTSGNKNNRLINMCKKFSTDTYLSPVGSKDYLDISLFNKSGIKVKFLDFGHPIYPQGKNDFFSYLSIVDMLVNVGPIVSRRIISDIKLHD